MRKLFNLMFFLLPVISLHGYELIVRSPEGEVQTIDVPNEINIETFADSLRNKFGNNQDFLIDFMAHSPQIKQAEIAGTTNGRNYYATLSSNERNDIKYIVNTLGMASLTKLARDKSSLKKAGSRINHIHPLKFLATVFSDDEMKTSMHAMQNRGWVWGDFFDGIKSSLDEEMNRGNLLQFTYDFANLVGIDPNLIYKSISNSDWKQFINTLIEKIPRNSDVDRYNM